jgi:hypothetical protein
MNLAPSEPHDHLVRRFRADAESANAIPIQPNASIEKSDSPRRGLTKNCPTLFIEGQERRSRPSFDLNAQLAADRSGGHPVSSMLPVFVLAKVVLPQQRSGRGHRRRDAWPTTSI